MSRKISVRVKTNSKSEGIIEVSTDNYIIKVSVPPIDGKANKRIAKLLSDELGVPKSKLKLTLGSKSKNKVFEVSD